MATVEHRLRSAEDAADPAADEARARLEQLYRTHGERVFAICASLLRDRHEAEDAAQQVFVSALGALLRGTEPRDPGAWLATIARNESWARARRQPSVQLLPGLHDVAQEDPSTVVVRRSELARVWRALEGLPASQRDALLLREVRGLGYDELVSDLQLSHPSVRSLLNRARRTLRDQLAKGAAALTGAPWPNLVARLFGDASSPAVSSASRAAAVGLGALAITGGAVVAPSLTGHGDRRPAAHASAHRGVSSASPAGRADLLGVAAPAPARPPSGTRAESRAEPRGDHRSRPDSRIDGRRSGDDASSRHRAGDDGSPGGGDQDSDPHGGPTASSGAGGPGSGSSAESARNGGRDASGTDGGSGDGSPRGAEAVRTGPGSDGSDGTSRGGGPGPSTSGDTRSSDGSETQALSASLGSGDSHGGTGEGSSSGGSDSTSDGDGGGSSGSPGTDDGSGGPGSSGDGS